MNDLSGQNIKGYELREQLAAGGFGAVYRAYQSALDREVAIKIILPKYANEPNFIRSFEAEAQLVARLEHLHIVPLYDFWRDPNGAYLVMRMMRGGSLRQSMDRAPWHVKPIVQLVKQIAGALATAHQNGVIHRDIKPANILLDEEENAYLSDFGIAKNPFVESDEEIDATIIGSPGYIAPERIAGLDITPKSDIYSLGIIIYELLANEHPFPGRQTAIALFHAHQFEEFPSILKVRSDMPEELDMVILKATAKNPDDRYDDVITMANAFRRALGAESRPIELVKTRDGMLFADLDTELTPISTVTHPENPYRGLRAFEEVDSEVFFGREALTEDLLKRLTMDGEAGRFIAVVGPSGSGKSSVVRAGLFPLLRGGALPGSADWFFVDMMPGHHPMEELESGLLSIAVNPPPTLLEQLNADARGLLRAVKRALPRDDSSELVLFIDQFEELFTLVGDMDERQHVLASLVEAAAEPRNRLRVIITLRADFYDRPLMYPDFGALIRRTTELVLPLKADELERAIVGPARKAGARVDDTLVKAIISEVSHEPGALPLLQYALTELFDRRVNNALKLEIYHEIGGALGALARRADEIYESLNADEKEATRQLFLRLVRLGEGTEDTRRRAFLDEVLSLQSDRQVMQRAIDEFGQYRLLTFDRDPTTRSATIEVAHEAILREWGRLRNWLDRSREDIRHERRLAALAREWDESGRDASFLLRGAHLNEVDTWAGATDIILTEEESRFVEESRAENLHVQQTEIARQAREVALEHQSRNRLRFLVGVMTLATILAVALTIFAFRQQVDAQNASSTAEVARQEAEIARSTSDANAVAADDRAQQVESLALVDTGRRLFRDGNHDMALLMALKAAKGPNPLPQARQFLNEVVDAPGTVRIIQEQGDPVWRVVMLPDGSRAITSSGYNTALIQMWDLQAGEEVLRYEGHTGLVLGLALHGDTLLTSSTDGTFRVWDVMSGDELRRFPMELGEQVTRLIFSPDGQTFIAGSQDGIIRIRDIHTGAIRQQRQVHEAAIQALAVSPDGAAIISSAHDGHVVAWDLTTNTVDSFLGEAEAIATQPNGQYITLGGDTGEMVLASVQDAGSVLRVLHGHNGAVTALRFTSDSSRVVSVGEDSTLIVHDVGTGDIVHLLRGHKDVINDVALDANGKFAVTVARDGEIRLWDIQGTAGEIRSYTVAGDAFALAVSPDESRIAVSIGDPFASSVRTARVSVLDAKTGLEIGQISGDSAPINGLEFSPNGAWLLSTSADGTARLWQISGSDAESFKASEVFALGNQDAPFYRAAFSPDGQWALVGGYQNEMRLWNLTTGEAERRFANDDQGHSGSVVAVAFSPDGSQALSGGADGLVILWDVETGRVLRRFDEHEDMVMSVAFSPDGRTAASGSLDKKIVRWNLETGAVIAEYEMHEDGVMRVAFSPDGMLLMSASRDGTVQMWDVLHNMSVRRFGMGNVSMDDLAFSADGHRVFSTSKRVQEWLLPRLMPIEQMMAEIPANRYVPVLNCDQQEEYLLLNECEDS